MARSTARRGSGTPPAIRPRTSRTAGPLTRTIATPAGGAPLDNAKIVARWVDCGLASRLSPNEAR